MGNLPFKQHGVAYKSRSHKVEHVYTGGGNLHTGMPPCRNRRGYVYPLHKHPAEQPPAGIRMLRQHDLHLLCPRIRNIF